MNYRDKFGAAHPGPPWTCEFCGQPITHRHGMDSGALVVHHIDEDRSNDALTNLAPMHRRCHVQHHLTGKPLTDTHLENLRAAASRRGPSEVHRGAMRAVWERRSPAERTEITVRSAGTRLKGGASPQRPRRVPGTSEYKGVDYYRPRGSWRARISHLGKVRHLGLFATAEDAANAYDEASRAQYGDRAILNFPIRVDTR